MDTCTCGHTIAQHQRLSGHCLAFTPANEPCPCSHFHIQPEQATVQISVLLNEQGESRVVLMLGDVQIQLHPDACMTLALEFVSAANQARVKEALAKYAYTHNIPLPEILQ